LQASSLEESPLLVIVALAIVNEPPLTTRNTFWSDVVLAQLPPSIVALVPSTR
jgi:hypothetical protein